MADWTAAGVERRIRNAPEIRGIDPFGQSDRFQLAAIAVLVDLMLATIHPDLFDQALSQIERDAARGDVLAERELRWMRDWRDGTGSLARTVLDSEIRDLTNSGRALLGQFFLVASLSDIQTKEPRFATLYSTLKRLDEELNFLAAACVIFLDVAFQDNKQAVAQSKAAAPSKAAPVGAAPPSKSALQQATSSSNNGCYVATSVYGSYDCPEVWALRRWRDAVLSQTEIGKAAIHVYYAVSPGLVRTFGGKRWFVSITRKPLDAFVSSLIRRGVSDAPYRDR
ncbi:CFI-box-CTERM domain-containing protein [Agromyces sp. MMS24-JH15]|uniref:CFI-box-CTERM domain-containing protein n=1 Tax=Agromyces sp. MMS24-JH15 TaxID=3243765 RepID=UPI003749415C